MADSPLAGGATRAPQRPKGTGTDVLGPSDLSDSGSDLVGAAGATDTFDDGFDSGTLDDIRREAGAGADIGDADLDSDSDSGGTGERAEAGRDTLRRDAPDIGADRIDAGPLASVDEDAEMLAEADQFATDVDNNDADADSDLDDDEDGEDDTAAGATRR